MPGSTGLALMYHHFVRLEAICSGQVDYLDPWRTGDPDNWEAADFPFHDGNGWVRTTTHTHEAGDSPRPRERLVGFRLPAWRLQI